ncbi:MAG: hypothetical protein N2114_02485 [Candidatus Goldbacteria bacterium]|nr:hypothetical protein [Candidatus Goldiibacteriota bacterium]
MDDNNMIYILLGTIIIFFILRVPLILLAPKGVDVFFHLISAKKFRRGRAPKKLDSFVLYNEYTHPPLYHFLIFLTPDNLKEKMPLLIDIMFDFGSFLLCYFLAKDLFGEQTAILATFIYSVTPINFIEGISQTPRPVGIFFYNLSIILLLNNTTYLNVLASFSIALLLLTHKMSTQALAFSVLLLFPLAIQINFTFLLFVILGVILALVLSNRFYIIILKDHIGILKFHFKYGSWKDNKKSFGKPLEIVKFEPYCFIPLIGAIFNLNWIIDLNYFFAWYFGLLALFFLWRWGDNYRYLSFISIPTSIISAQFLSNNIFFFIFPPLFISILLIIKNIINFIKCPSYSYLSKIVFPEDSKILVFPTKLVYETAYYSRQKIICGGGNKDSLKFEYEELIPIVKKDICLFLSKYNITHIFIEKSQIEIIKKIPNNFYCKSEINNYILYEKKL